jgi:hypothetical protein
MSSWQLWLKDTDTIPPKDNVDVLALVSTKDSRAQQHVAYHNSDGWHLRSCCLNCQLYSDQVPFEVHYWMPLPKEPPYGVREKKESNE